MNSFEFIGNDSLVEALTALVSGQRFPHSVILSGERGIGKKSLASHIAALLLKSNQNPHPDLFLLDCGEKGVGVDGVREIKSTLYEKPNQADYKVYMLFEADLLTTQAQNALLKMIEEPPEYGVFILTSQNPSGLLETVLSRTVTFQLNLPSVEEASRYLSRRYDAKEAEKLARIFSGNIGKSILATEDEEYRETMKAAHLLGEKIVEGDAIGFYRALEQFSGRRRGAEARRVFGNLFEILRDSVRLLPISNDRKASVLEALYQGMITLERNGAMNMVHSALVIRIFGSNIVGR